MSSSDGAAASNFEHAPVMVDGDHRGVRECAVRHRRRRHARGRRPCRSAPGFARRPRRHRHRSGPRCPPGCDDPTGGLRRPAPHQPTAVRPARRGPRRARCRADQRSAVRPRRVVAATRSRRPGLLVPPRGTARHADGRRPDLVGRRCRQRVLGVGSGTHHQALRRRAVRVAVSRVAICAVARSRPPPSSPPS